MKNFEQYFRNPRLNIEKKRCVIKLIRKNYGVYSQKNMAISECLPAFGTLTADLIVFHIKRVNNPKTAYDTILVVAINYFTMLYMDIFSDYCIVNKKHTYLQVFSLVEEVLKESKNTNVLAIDDFDDALCSSYEISKQVVDTFLGSKKLVSHYLKMTY